MKRSHRSHVATAALVLASLALPQITSAAPKVTPDSMAFPQTTSPIPIEASDPQLGRRDALLTLVVFADYNALAYAYFRLDGALAALRAHYGAELRLVFKDLPQPMFSDAVLRGAAVRGVYAMGGEAAFTAFVGHVGLFPGAIDEATLAGFAMVSGVDKARFEAGLRDGKWTAEVQKNAQLSRETLKLSSVPVFYLNGKRYDGMQKPEALYADFDRELEASRAELRGGITARDVYTLRSKQNFGRLLLESQRAKAEENKNWLIRNAPRVEPGVGIGRIRLGMTLDELAAVRGIRVKRWSGERACVAPNPNSDDCPYLVFTSGGVIERIQYKVASDGVTIQNKTFEKRASFDEIRNSVGCGAIEPAAAGVLVSCPGKVTLVKENVGCIRFLQHTESTPCNKAFEPGSEDYAIDVEISR